MFTADSRCSLILTPCPKLLRIPPPKPPFLAPKKLFTRTSSTSPISSRSTSRFLRKPLFTGFQGAKTPIRASSWSPSSSPSPKPIKYDVFVSFRGEDTREGFTGHLYSALRRKKIDAYLDDEKLRKGEKIPPALKEAIKRSRIAVVVLSRNFASSRWCLDELLEIIKCKNNSGMIVLPVFYEIEPTDVRRQTGSYAAALAEHKKVSVAKMKRWRRALTEVANLSGFDSKVIRSEAKLIDQVVAHILNEIDRIYKENDLSRSATDELIGVELRIEAVEKLLGFKKDDSRCVGICGMGGIGKTALAGAIFNRHCGQFEGCCFLANVRAKSKEWGLISLRNEMLQQILDRKDIHIETPDVDQRFLRDELRRTRVFIVLDDVSSFSQLEFLIKDIGYFGPGSKIIVTSRDKDVLKHRVDAVHEIKGLVDNDALQLFLRYAFKRSLPSEDHLRLAKRAVLHAKGNPLAIIRFGSYLSQKSVKEWQSAFDRLKKFPDAEIQSILKMSCDDLNEEEKEIFLHIACFFKGEDINVVTSVLNACGFSADIGIRALIDKHLVTIAENRLEMHDLIQDMGREIVRQEAPREPGKRTRLWNHDDIYEVLTKDKGTELVECIILNLSEVQKMQLSPQAFAKMCNLRFLKFYTTGDSKDNCKLQFPEGLEFLPNGLKYLHWDNYSLKSFPSGFCPEELVKLSMNYSCLERLWDGPKDLRNLRWIDLSFSVSIKIVPDLSGAPHLARIILRGCRELNHLSSIRCKLNHLELLDLSGCSNMKEFPVISWDIKELLLVNTAIEEIPATVRNFKQLVRLDMRNCKMLKKISNIDYELASLEYFNLSGCSKVTCFPEISRNLKKLFLNETSIEEVPPSVSLLEELVLLDLQNCKRLKSLPSDIGKLKSLQKLNLSGCSNFDSFPEILDSMNALRCLCLNGTGITTLTSSIGTLFGLSSLDLGNCKSLISLPDGFCNLLSLEDLNLSGCSRLVNFPKCSISHYFLRKLRANSCNSQVIALLYHALPSLRVLHLRDCGLSEFPEILTHFSSLTELDLSRNSFEKIPWSIRLLDELQSLDVSYSEKLLSLPELPDKLRKLDAHNCVSLESLWPDGICKSKFYQVLGAETYVFANCYKLGEDALSTIVQYAKRRLSVRMFDLRFTLYFLEHMTRSTEMPPIKPWFFLSRMHEYKDYNEALRGLHQDLLHEDPAPEESPHAMECRIIDAFADPGLGLFSLFRIVSSFYQGKISSSFCYPGSDIPGWFQYQSIGSCICIKRETDTLSSGAGLYESVTICAVVDFENYHEDNGVNVKYECHVHANKFGSYHCVRYLRGWDGQKGESMLVEGDHLFLGCDFCLIFNEAYGSKHPCTDSQLLVEFSFEFFVVDGDDNPINCCRVTKCGISLGYLHDEFC